MACLITGQGLAPRACAVCRRRDGLLRCSACEVTFYCSRDHQVSHRPAHKKACTAVKKARQNYLDEDQALRSISGHVLVPDDVFRNGVGHFWAVHAGSVRPRRRAPPQPWLRRGPSRRRPGLSGPSAGHDEAVPLRQHGPTGLRDIVPSLLIRLGRDQEAYDFVKWYATTGNASDYDWGGDMSLPFLDVKDADVLEPVDDLRFELSHAISVLLIKTRLLLDLEAFQAASSCPLAGRLPAEILHLIQDQLVGPTLKARPELLLDRTTDDRVSGVVEHVKAQVAALFKSIDKQNDHFWPSMLHRPESAIAHRPPNYLSPRSREEAILVIGYTYPAWAETRGAIELMKKLKTTL